MSRIDRSRVVGKDEEELNEFTCDICLQIFEELVVTQCCRKTYCTVCINEWLADNNNTCPNDRKRLTVRHLIPASRMTTNLLNKLKIKCENYTHCQSVLTIEEMANHLKKCNFCDSCKTSQKLLSDNKKTIETLKSEIVKMKTDLGHLEEELSGNKSKINRLESENGVLKSDLDQSKKELNKFRANPLPIFIEAGAINNARSISTPIVKEQFQLSEEEVHYLTNLAISGLSQKSFVNISKFIHDQIKLKSDFKELGWVIITNFKDRFTHYSNCDKILRLAFNGIDIFFVGFKTN